MCIPNFPFSFSGPTDNVHLTAADRNCQSGLQCKVLPRATEMAIGASRENPKGRNCPSFDPCLRHFSLPLPPSSTKSALVCGSPIPLAGGIFPNGNRALAVIRKDPALSARATVQRSFLIIVVPNGVVGNRSWCLSRNPQRQPEVLGGRRRTRKLFRARSPLRVNGRSHPFQPKLIVDSLSEFLLAAQVSFGRLN